MKSEYDIHHKYKSLKYGIDITTKNKEVWIEVLGWVLEKNDKV